MDINVMADQQENGEFKHFLVFQESGEPRHPWDAAESEMVECATEADAHKLKGLLAKRPNINTLISRCLTHGVVISPYQQDAVFKKYEQIKIPDNALNVLSKHDLKQYVNALYLCSLEMAGDWATGFRILEGLGFERVERKEGHRVFASLSYKKADKITG